MTSEQNAALVSFLRTLSAAQKTAMMDVVSQYVENVNADMDPDVDDLPAEFSFVEAVINAIVFSVVADTPAAATE